MTPAHDNICLFYCVDIFKSFITRSVIIYDELSNEAFAHCTIWRDCVMLSMLAFTSKVIYTSNYYNICFLLYNGSEKNMN